MVTTGPTPRYGRRMGDVICNITVSADGFVAGPDQTKESPLGVGGEELHQWQFNPQGDEQGIIDDWQGAAGAYVMGRNMFAGPGEWDPDWRGWWGEEPPYHAPVFVLTHHEREPLEMAGGTTFHFVTDGIEAALARAREAAGDRTVDIAGGADTVNQYLSAGLIDQLHLHIAPRLLGSGARLFDGVPPQVLSPLSVSSSPNATHVKYAIG
jgi:dihydrofolate reductase